MKNFKIVFSFILFLIFNFNSAQKTGFVDIQYVLENMPQYKESEARLNAQINTWQIELHALQSEYEKKRSAFENEKILLVGDQLKFREKEITELEKNIKTTTSLRFGANGEITQLRKNLVIPFEDQIYNAITIIGEKNGLNAIQNKNENILYVQKRFDYTQKVLDFLLNNKVITKEKK